MALISNSIEVNMSLKDHKLVYLSGAFTALIKWNILFLFAVHPHARLGRIPLLVCLKLHLSQVVKQLRQMLLDLSKQTGTLSLGGLGIYFSIFPAAVQINNVSLLFFRRAEPTFCKMPANVLLERFSGKLCLTVIYFTEAEVHRKVS